MSLGTHERFVSYPAIFDSNVINHIRSVRPSPGVERMIITPGGSIDPKVIAEAYRDPRCDLTSGDLGAILAFVSPSAGLAISSSGLMQWQQRADGGTFLGSGNHVTISSPKGFLAITEVSAQQDAKEGADLKLSYWGLRSGANAPFLFNTAQNLTGSVLVNGLYRLSSVTYEGTKVLGVQSVSVKTGIKYETKRESGNVAADVGSIVQRGCSIEVRGTNLTLAATVGAGLTAVSTGLVVYFEQIGVSGAHQVSFTISGGAYSVQGIDGRGTGDCEGTIMAELAAGTLSYSTTATLP